MKIKTPLDGASQKTHFAYHFWIYILIIAASVFGWNLLYTMTAYRSPENKRIDLYIQSNTVSQESAEAFLKPIWESTVPEMEAVDSVILASNAQDYYSSMQLTVYIMAQEGDIYLMNSADFKTYASQGVFIDLQPYIDAGRIDVSDIDLSAGFVAPLDEEGLPESERRLFGIPIYSLYGYADGLGLDNRDMILGVTAFSGNEENVIAFLNGFLAAGRGERPGWMNQ